jgi:hypothetical protein
MPQHDSCPNPPGATNYSEDRDEEYEQTAGAIPNINKTKGFEKMRAVNLKALEFTLQ